MKKMISRLLFLSLLIGVIAVSVLPAQSKEQSAFTPCPFPPCLAPCAFPPEPEGICKSPDGSTQITSFTCCCCGGGGFGSSFRRF